MLPISNDSYRGGVRLSPGDIAQAIERFCGTIKFRTVSALEKFSLEPFHCMRSYSERAWSNVFSSLDMEIHGGASILLKWQGDPSVSLKPIMLTAHQDVVPVGNPDNWSHDPFGADVAGDRVWGRGTLDYKCGFGGMLEAVSVLLASGFKPKRTVYLAFGHDEEVGGFCGAKAIAESLRNQDITCSSVLDEGGYIYSDSDGGSSAELAIAEKGYASFRLTASAIQGHSSVPPARTAIGILARGITALEKTSMPLPDMPEEIQSSAMLQTTFAPTIISGGYKENVLPASAEVTINTRPSPGNSVAEVQDFIDSIVSPLGITVDLLDNTSVSEPSTISGTHTEDFKALKTSILNNVPPGTRFRCGVFPAATDSRRYSMIAQNVYRFLPVHLSERGIGALHSVDESIAVSDYIRCVKFYAEYISRLSSGS